MNVRRAAFNRGDQARRAMLAKVHIARKELGLDEATYRAVLLNVTGQESAADLTVEQLGKVLDNFKAKGWTPAVVAGGRKDAPARKRQPADHPSARKARAMWISLWQLGVVRDRSEAALEAFARRQLGVERMQFADQALTYKLIEALKAMAERAGWSQDLAGIPPSRQVRALKMNLIRAQWAKLSADSPPPLAGRGLTDEDLDRIIAEQGADIRRLGDDA